MFNIKFNKFYYILIIIIVIFLDQFTKYLININYHSLINKDLIIFTIKNVRNYGAAFDLFTGRRLFLSFISLIVSIALLYIILNNKNKKTSEFYSYSFLLGGTIGNGIDRIINGYVIDFISINFLNFPVFNIADISINIGFILFLYSFIKHKR